MIFEARVVDNSTFVTTGKIVVRIKNFCPFGTYFEDFSSRPSSITDSVKKYTTSEGNEVIEYSDTMAYVSSPMAGGYDYGAFVLPQVNSYGIVATLGDDDNPDSTSKEELVWLGGIFKPNRIGTVDCPSPSLSAANGIEVKSSNMGNSLNGGIVVKVKNTVLADPTDAESSRDNINFKKRPIQALVVIDEDQVSIERNILEDDEVKGVQKLTMTDDGGIKAEYKTEDSAIDTELSIDENGYLNYKQYGTSGGTNFDITTDGSELNSTVFDDSNNSIISQTKKKIELNTGNVFETLSGKKITLSSDSEIILDATRVSLGHNGQKYPVALLTSGKTAAIDNVTITASDSIFG